MGEALFSLSEVADAVHGVLRHGQASRSVSAVSIDSRTTPPESLFVPLAGSRADGHDYVEDALRAGAVAFLASRAVWATGAFRMLAVAERYGAGIVTVDDTLRSLQALAAWHLRRLSGLLKVGITGSNGKTTTKEMIGAILGGVRPTAVSPGNLNSETGLPLSCFLVPPGTAVAVFEMAMNHLGEIADLAEIVRPDFGLITNIGLAHIGFCGTQRAIALEKKAIFRHFSGRELAFLPVRDRYFDLLAEGVAGRIVPFGRGATRGFERSEDRGLDGSIIHWEGLRIRLPLVGRHNAENALAAISVAMELGIPSACVRDALESARPLPGRSEILRGRVTVISDCYNSSPDSVRELLDLLRSIPRSSRRIGVFGSMLELGERTADDHAWLGKALAGAGFDALCFFGAEARGAYDAAMRSGESLDASWAADFGDLEKRLGEVVRDGDLVVLKGSRGVQLERAIPELLRRREGAPCC